MDLTTVYLLASLMGNPIPEPYHQDQQLQRTFDRLRLQSQIDQQQRDQRQLDQQRRDIDLLRQQIDQQRRGLLY